MPAPDTAPFDAYVVTGPGPAALTRLTDADLPTGDVTVDVTHSSLNYKDGLALTGVSPVARTFPMVCGIDLAGTVLTSDHPDWKPGDRVLVTGCGLGETRPGGFTRRQRVPADVLVRTPDALTPVQAMAIGTAGLTAMLALLRLEHNAVTPASGPVLVTGAGGGVGSVAVALLSGLGYEVVAATGRPATHDRLRALGASSFLDRAELATASAHPVGAERWAAAIDTVGGHTLASILKGLSYDGAVAVCGLVGGMDLPASVVPFLLRGITVTGIDSAQCPWPVRLEAWRRIGQDLPLERLDALTTVRGFGELPLLAEEILGGGTEGRVVIDTRA